MMEVKIYYTADKFDSQPYVMTYEVIDIENIVRVANHIVNRISERLDSGKVTEVTLESDRASVTFKEGLIPFLTTDKIVTAINFLFF